MADLTERTRAAKAYRVSNPDTARETVHRLGPRAEVGFHADLTEKVRATAELHRIFGTAGALEKGVADIRALWLKALGENYSLLTGPQGAAIRSAWQSAFGESLDALPPDQVYKGNGRNVGDHAAAKAAAEPHEYDGGKDGEGPCTSCGESESEGNHL